MEHIGPYEIVDKIGHGGMGEVFLAKDPLCERLVAIKRIKPDLRSHDIMRKRFLREAKITASLYHPSIIPVHAIHEEGLYYVMPYVEGSTLKSLLRETLHREKQGTPVSLAFLIPMFVRICHAIAYCHARGILHRDLKPENILIGNFGQVIILDWGLAGPVTEDVSLPIDLKVQKGLTNPGKVVGTLPYMPPERVDGSPADIHTDIYSLGVILYQMLTLKMPFRRSSIKEYRKVKQFETLVDALEAAPYRDVPQALSNIAKKCLAKERHHRYASVEELIHDLERYTSGHPDWIFSQELDMHKKEDWELQENVLLSKLIPITRSTEIMQWYVLMISKTSFSGNKKIEARLTFQKETDGIGFLLNIPAPKEREGLEDGYCLWIGSAKNPGIKLYRSHVVILEIPDKFVETGIETLIEIEKIDQVVQLFINKTLVINYTDSLPIVGTHIGLLMQDMDFTLNSVRVSVGSPHAMVGCLSIPDAFLASKNFDEALIEYERIAKSFTGRAESREAIFRTGITLLEKAKFEEAHQPHLFEQALNAFEQLHGTPLEYLGKSLVYRKTKELDEELKCLELGVRKCKHHTHLHQLEERIIFRLHESAKQDRKAVYEFALLTLHLLPHLLANRETHALIHTLLKSTEPPPFFHEATQLKELPELYRHMAIELAFWLNKAPILRELLSEETNPLLQDNARRALAALGHEPLDPPYPLFLQLHALLERGMAQELLNMQIPEPHQKLTDPFRIWAHFLLKQFDAGKALLEKYPREAMEKPQSPFFFLQGCYFAKTNGFEAALKHFKQMPDYTYPPLYALLGHSLKNTNLQPDLFLWEEAELLRQKILFSHCLGKRGNVLICERKLKKTGVYSKLSLHGTIV